jgi:hypothetical protein
MRLSGSLSAELIGGHLARALVLDELEGDLLTFPEIAHASALDCGDVDEHVLAAIIRLNEAETLGGIEPFNCADAMTNPFAKCMKHVIAHAQDFRFFER